MGFLRRLLLEATSPSTGEEIVKLGAGGFVTGIMIAPDGTQVVRTDTYGAYTRNASGEEWRQMLTFDSMPAGHVGYEDFVGTDDGEGGDLLNAGGVYEIAIAPSNSDIMYMMWNNRLYKSTDKGFNWSYVSAYTGATFDPNDSFRVNGRRMAVNPTDPDHLIITSPQASGQTLNGGTSFAALTSVLAPTSTRGGHVAWHPSDPNIVYVGVNGRGVYVSTNEGSTWTLTTSGPTTMQNMAVGANGVLMCCSGETATGGHGNNIYKYASGTWSNLSVTASGSNDTWHDCAPDLDNAGHWVAISDAGQGIYTANDGTSWTSPSGPLRVATDIPWLENTNEGYMSGGGICYNPQETNELVFAQGIGVWVTNPPATSSAYTWTSQSLGIDQLVVQWIDTLPDGTPVVSCWDRPIFRLDPDNAVYPSEHGINYTFTIMHGWSWDWAKSDPDFLVCFGTRHNVGAASGLHQIGYSDDAGVTWTELSTPWTGSTPAGGSVAVATPSNWLICGHGTDSRARYTNNAGTTWNFCTLSGVPTSGETGLGISNNVHRRMACCDADGFFYIYTNGTEASNSSAGVWKSNSANDASAFTKVFNGRLSTGSSDNNSYAINAWNGVLVPMPGFGGRLFWTGGDVGGNVAGKFLRSMNAGVTWTEIPHVREAQGAGWGAPGPGQSCPSLHITGWYEGDYGVWVCENSDETDVNDMVWTKKATYPVGRFDTVTTVSGNMDIYGVTYVGYRGCGLVRVVWA